MPEPVAQNVLNGLKAPTRRGVTAAELGMTEAEFQQTEVQILSDSPSPTGNATALPATPTATSALPAASAAPTYYYSASSPGPALKAATPRQSY